MRAHTHTHTHTETAGWTHNTSACNHKQILLFVVLIWYSMPELASHRCPYVWDLITAHENRAAQTLALLVDADLSVLCSIPQERMLHPLLLWPRLYQELHPTSSSIWAYQVRANTSLQIQCIARLLWCHYGSFELKRKLGWSVQCVEKIQV